MDLTMRIRDMLRTNEDEADRLERVALTYLLDSANARLRDLEERVGRLERPDADGNLRLGLGLRPEPGPRDPD